MRSSYTATRFALSVPRRIFLYTFWMLTPFLRAYSETVRSSGMAGSVAGLVHQRNHIKDALPRFGERAAQAVAWASRFTVSEWDAAVVGAAVERERVGLLQQE